jgi:hypothetical protein
MIRAYSGKIIAIHPFRFPAQFFFLLAHFHAPEVVGQRGRRFSPGAPLPGGVGQHFLSCPPTKKTARKLK